MSFEVTLKEPCNGYAANAARSGETVSLIVQEFSSSEDGDLFISRLEGLPSMILSALPLTNRPKPSMVDRLLAVIRRNQTATIYLNEDVPLLCTYTQKGRDIKTGDAVQIDDIADIQSVDFQEISIPDDCGFVFLFSIGWRKGLYFDLKPLYPPRFQSRNYDLSITLGTIFAYVWFQHLFKLDDDDWNALIAQRWFPFVSLRNKTIKEIVSYANNRWDIDELTEQISNELKDRLPGMLKKWKLNPLFDAHFALVSRAIETYLAGDYISSASILYPRIEGLMRAQHSTFKNKNKNRVSSRRLVSSVIENSGQHLHSHSLLLPKSFTRYLHEVYFADFDPSNPNVFSRHSIAHGVAPVGDFSLKAATIGLLILDQLSFHLRS